MAVDKSVIKSTYPLPSYNYRVTVLQDGASLAVGFSEVSGLQVEYTPVSYQHGLSFVLGKKIIPGMLQDIRITLKRGVVKSNDFLQSWFSGVYTNPFFANPKRDILIDLCDESGTPVVRWTVSGALPVKLEASNFAADGNDIAIETLELVAHRLSVNYNP
jgi:phage tail-like protein